MLDINSFLEKYISPDEKIIVACSTGADSMFLLYQLLGSKYKWNIVACYFNHKTRPECDEEEEYLRLLWKKEWFQVETAECNFEKIQKLYPSKSFEELAREKRYQFFAAVSHMYQAKYTLTAHHLDDRVETFFFNLVRWTKLTGLINMTESSGSILRPMLGLKKSDILNFIEENNIRYFEDSTNSDTEITRNSMRIDILPRLEQVNKRYAENIGKTLSYFEDLRWYVDEEVKNFLWGRQYFETLAFKELPSFLQKEVIRYIYFTSNNNSTIGLSESNIAEIIRFINGKNNKTVKEIRGLRMEKDNLIINLFTIDK